MRGRLDEGGNRVVPSGDFTQPRPLRRSRSRVARAPDAVSGGEPGVVAPRLSILLSGALFAAKQVGIDGRWRRAAGLALFWVGLGRSTATNSDRAAKHEANRGDAQAEPEQPGAGVLSGAHAVRPDVAVLRPNQHERAVPQ